MENIKTALSRRVVPWIALTGLVSIVFIVLTPFLIPLAWACVLGYATWPIARRINQWCRGRDTLAALITTALLAVTLFVPLIGLAWLAQNEVATLYPALQAFLIKPIEPDILSRVPVFNNALGGWLLQQAQILNNPQGLALAIKTWMSAHANDFAALAGGIGKNIVKMIFVVIIVFFFYRDGARIIAELRYVLTKFIGQQAHDYLQAAGNTTRAVVYGVLLTALAQGAAAGIGYWVAGLSSPVILGAITALLSLIPFCTPIAWGLAGFWLLLHGQTSAAIGLWLWGALVVSQLDNVLRPIFISSVSQIPFLLVLFGVLGGLLAFGLIGLFIGPIVLAVAWAVWREWTEHLHDAEAFAALNTNEGTI